MDQKNHHKIPSVSSRNDRSSVAEIVPDFRRDDVWIPGFPGMTFLEVSL